MQRALAVGLLLLTPQLAFSVACSPGTQTGSRSAESRATPPDPGYGAGADDARSAQAADETEETLERVEGAIEAAALEAPVEAASNALPRSGLTRGVGDVADRELALGDAAQARGDYERALGHYRRARRAIPEHAAPVVGIVQARFGVTGIPLEYGIAPRDTRVDELSRLLEQAERLDAGFAPALLLRGQLELVRGKAEAAERSLEQSRALLPNDPEAHSSWAIARLARGDEAGALAGFARAVELAPNDARRLNNLGAAWLLNGDPERAIRVLERAVQLAPNDARANGDLGSALLAAGKVKQALSALGRARELAPERATFASNLCYAHRLDGNLDAALDVCNRAVALDPKLGSAWLNLGSVLAVLTRYDEARSALQRARALDPEDPRVEASLTELDELRRQSP